MVRTKQQLKESRDSLQLLVRRLEKEIELIDADIASLGAEIRLDDKFFWDVLVPMIVGSDGIPTNTMLRSLSNRGYDPTPGNFRTFISRYGQRGYLEASGRGRALLWKLTPKTLSEFARQKGQV